MLPSPAKAGGFSILFFMKLKIGIPVEIHPGETRQMLLPENTADLNGYDIYYAGNPLKPSEIFKMDMVLKLKMPIKGELDMMREGGILFCMIHPGQNPKYVKAIKDKKLTAIAMENVKDEKGERLIDCCSLTGEAGMLYAFNKHHKMPYDCNILCLGYGRVASGAIKIAHQLGAQVKILRRSEFPFIKDHLKGVDVLINALAWPIEWVRHIDSHRLVKRADLGLLNEKAIVLDLSVDYPSPIETCRPTTVANPCYEINGIIHIGIYGYPSLKPFTSMRIYSNQIRKILQDWAKIVSIKTSDWGGDVLPQKTARASFIEHMPEYLKNAVVK